MSIFKKKGSQVNAANVHMTEAEAALAQSDFNIEKITEIQNKFAGGAVLLVPGRIFIREGVLYKVCRKGLKKRQFFLFNDILVYGKIVAGLYSNQAILPLSQMSVSADCFYQPRVNADFVSETDEDNLDVANAFQISHANKSFHVFGQSASDKANWIANLQKHISRVAKTLSDSQQQVLTRPVWVPDSMSKECMICSTKFSAFQRKHHCRRCGRVVCTSCSPHRVSLVTGEGSVVSGGGEGGGKLERTCRECFKEMTAVHHRANSIGSSTKRYEVTKSAPSRPPPPTVAAQIVSAALRTVTTPPKVEGGSPVNVDTSTDTEDSDDSGNEQEPQTKLPSPTSTGNTEVQRPVPKARQSLKEDATPPVTPPVPAARLSLKTSSTESSPTLQQKVSNQIADDENEPQPTPPPRKKKQMKQKLKEQQEPAVDEETKTDEQPEETKTDEQSEETKTDGQTPNNKKTRRKNKFRPLEDTKALEESVVAVDNDAAAIGADQPSKIVEDESRDNINTGEGGAGDSSVKSGAGDSVKGGAGDGVGSGTSDGVEGGGVEGGTGDSVKSEARDDVDGEPIKAQQTVQESVSNTVSNSETENVGASENGVDVKKGGDDSPSVNAASKRSGRRRNKFKVQT